MISGHTHNLRAALTPAHQSINRRLRMEDRRGLLKPVHVKDADQCTGLASRWLALEIA